MRWTSTDSSIRRLGYLESEDRKLRWGRVSKRKLECVIYILILLLFIDSCLFVNRFTFLYFLYQCLISILSVKSFHWIFSVILYQKELALSFLLYRLQIAPAFRALRDCSVDCSKFYFYKCSTSFYDTILVTLELGLIEGITLTSRPPFPRPFQCWPRTWTIPQKTHYKTTLEERKTE